MIGSFSGLFLIPELLDSAFWKSELQHGIPDGNTNCSNLFSYIQILSNIDLSNISNIFKYIIKYWFIKYYQIYSNIINIIKYYHILSSWFSFQYFTIKYEYLFWPTARFGESFRFLFLSCYYCRENICLKFWLLQNAQ